MLNRGPRAAENIIVTGIAGILCQRYWPEEREVDPVDHARALGTAGAADELARLGHSTARSGETPQSFPAK